MKYRKLFARIVENQLPGKSSEIIRYTEELHPKFYEDIRFSEHLGNPMDKRLDVAAYYLAFIKAMEKQDIAFIDIRSLCLDIAEAAVHPKNKLQAGIKRMQPELLRLGSVRWLLKTLGTKLGRKAHDKGFQVRIITKKADTYGFGYGIDIIECGICKLFNKHHAGIYTPILCEVDKITASMAGLQLVRSGTIAKGAEICDFRFKKL